MKRPKLQIALDHNTLASALVDVKKIGEIVDVIEVGTILCLQEGSKPIECMRKMFPEKTIVADTKCADAGETVAGNVAQAGADFMTVICCASLATMQAAQKKVKALQVELYGEWTMGQAKKWREIGISQVVYHQSRDALLAGEVWGEKDLKLVQQLIDLGFQVSVTGGLSISTLALFQGMPIFHFIVGRGLTACADPIIQAQAFQNEIKRLWGE
ncbi:3-keto-L-gulonate-6-phosphate decarboxylase UlaD [Enterococcus mundtii]|uniref:3-keto-L-gulonate-6-phosphate decarboxylase UlaD n=1 Tax=Enterococcus mundtii TaxID=53346 RepID=UPI000DFEAAFE|nr:3-keto-L-gulonate-6-phosphate decarboxylase UlaD [Enterococcus mundtii]STD25904.1 hexulose-6-phosphate synthase [Enterococcus mundtii]